MERFQLRVRSHHVVTQNGAKCYKLGPLFFGEPVLKPTYSIHPLLTSGIQEANRHQPHVPYVQVQSLTEMAFMWLTVCVAHQLIQSVSWMQPSACGWRCRCSAGNEVGVEVGCCHRPGCFWKRPVGLTVSSSHRTG